MAWRVQSFSSSFASFSNPFAILKGLRFVSSDNLCPLINLKSGWLDCIDKAWHFLVSDQSGLHRGWLSVTASAEDLGLQHISYVIFSCRNFGHFHPHLPISPYQLQVSAFPSQDDRMEITSVLQLSQVKDSHFGVKTSLLAKAGSPNCTSMLRWAGSLGARKLLPTIWCCSSKSAKTSMKEP